MFDTNGIAQPSPNRINLLASIKISANVLRRADSAGMKSDYVNLGCGSTYLPGWSNFDYAARPPWVQQCNLLGRLPIATSSCQVVYSSHFLEHIPKQKISFFLTEIFRILKPGGVARIVTPDFSEMCLAYASAYQSGDTDMAGFIQLEILDQCVRKTAGGELGKLYETLTTRDSSKAQDRIREMIYQRTGETLLPYTLGRMSPLERLKESLSSPKAAIHKLAILLRVKVACLIAPSAFVNQNVSQARIGENHAWLYTFNELASLLKDVGFVNPERMTYATTNDPGFPCNLLDMHPDGAPRKGAESMYVEAWKPH